jgi:hypothetical protein
LTENSTAFPVHTQDRTARNRTARNRTVRDRTARNRTVRDRTARNRIVRTGQPEQDSQNRTARTGGQDSQDKTTRNTAAWKGEDSPDEKLAYQLKFFLCKKSKFYKMQKILSYNLCIAETGF